MHKCSPPAAIMSGMLARRHHSRSTKFTLRNGSTSWEAALPPPWGILANEDCVASRKSVRELRSQTIFQLAVPSMQEWMLWHCLVFPGAWKRFASRHRFDLVSSILCDTPPTVLIASNTSWHGSLVTPLTSVVNRLGVMICRSVIEPLSTRIVCRVPSSRLYKCIAVLSLTANWYGVAW